MFRGCAYARRTGAAGSQPPFSGREPRRSVPGMSDAKTMIQTEVVFDGTSYLLSQDQDVGDLRHRIEEAARKGGTFVDVVVVGNRAVSVLITPTTRVAISVSTVAYDPRDTGDIDFPYSGYYDVL